MDIGAVGGSNQTAYTQQLSGAKELPKIVDVMSGALSDRVGLTITAAGGTRTASVSAATLTKSQDADLEALLAVLGIDVENAKTASIQTVLQAIQKTIRQQSSITKTVTETTTVSALSDLDVTALTALKKALVAEGSTMTQVETEDGGVAYLGSPPNPFYSGIGENIDRMLELKTSIEDKANNQGLTYDGNLDESSPNYSLNADVSAMGDCIANIRDLCAQMGDGEFDAVLDTLAPAMKTAVNDLLDAYAGTSGYGLTTITTYTTTFTVKAVERFCNVLESDDLQLPSQISKDALVQILKEILGDLGTDATAQEAIDKIEEKIQEIQAQLNDIEVEIPVQA